MTYKSICYGTTTLTKTGTSNYVRYWYFLKVSLTQWTSRTRVSRAWVCYKLKKEHVASDPSFWIERDTLPSVRCRLIEMKMNGQFESRENVSEMEWKKGNLPFYWFIGGMRCVTTSLAGWKFKNFHALLPL